MPPRPSLRALRAFAEVTRSGGIALDLGIAIVRTWRGLAITTRPICGAIASATTLVLSVW